MRRQPTHERFQTNSQRYSNDKTIEEVFENEHHHRKEELEDALAETELLNEKEAYAFVYGYVHEMSSTLEKQGFEDRNEYLDVKERAESKISDAIWIYKLISAFDIPDYPGKCTKCGNTLGGIFVEIGRDLLCTDCGNVNKDDIV